MISPLAAFLSGFVARKSGITPFRSWDRISSPSVEQAAADRQHGQSRQRVRLPSCAAGRWWLLQFSSGVFPNPSDLLLEEAVCPPQH